MSDFEGDGIGSRMMYLNAETRAGHWLNGLVDCWINVGISKGTGLVAG